METWVVNRDQCVYTSCYCEENIWKLCECWKKNNPNHLNSLYAVFISNERRQIPIWKQKSASNSEHLALWDYHVILIDKSSSPPVIYDFDSTLSFPISATDYVQLAIRDEINIAHRFHRMFRIIPAEEYLDVFASDRSHMLNEDKITYMAPPPSYPPISNQKSTNNINEFIDIKSKNAPGIVMNLADFRKFLGI
ncbi:unnamed protein product [Rotaria sp. Silwood2]|nr:unnamed protein product [Rotaria sp. Silwood2]CAF2877467.1 unnamed protein product [Rotaria sp. Silwood2]CAF4188147.1 unnamed protein product [Rotaria sp. Silwood2]CAF4297338.1 unnamed protein product [Rotaria sp. Silwood2]